MAHAAFPEGRFIILVCLEVIILQVVLADILTLHQLKYFPVGYLLFGDFLAVQCGKVLLLLVCEFAWEESFYYPGRLGVVVPVHLVIPAIGSIGIIPVESILIEIGYLIRLTVGDAEITPIVSFPTLYIKQFFGYFIG
jgi:hypothetical protein